MDELSLYNPTIIYKSGAENIIPDLLSRRDGVECIPDTTSIEPEQCQQVHALHKIQDIQDDLVNDWPLFYFKPEENWPEKIKHKLVDQKEHFKAENQFIWKK